MQNVEKSLSKGSKQNLRWTAETQFECQNEVLHLAGNNPVKRSNLAPGGEKQHCREGPRGPGEAEPGVTSGSHPFSMWSKLSNNKG